MSSATRLEDSTRSATGLPLRCIEEQYDTQDWPDTDEQWRKRWLDTVAGLLDHVNRCDGLLTMSTPARW
uniref:hypothetical protein n=1 Tax=Nocardia carnea TaxID=37328 RepID=UPI002458CF76